MLTCTFSQYLLGLCGHHHNLHSFPTRRSSDLCRGLVPDVQPAPGIRHCAGRRAPRGGCRGGTGGGWIGVKRRRSEEHTSELQSRQYLVCRLLLEKKKKALRSTRANRGWV